MDGFVGAATGALKSVSLRDSSFSNLSPIKGLEPKQHEITAMAFTGMDQAEVLVAQLDRQLRLYDSVSSNFSSLFPVEGEGRIRSVHVTSSQDIVTASDTGAVQVWTKEGEMKGSHGVGEGLLTMDVTTDGRMAVGGKNVLLRLIDPSTMQESWKSRNVSNDFLDLEVPIWDMQARFLNNNDSLIATTTGTHEIRLYDTRAQRKPVKRKEWLEEPITALAVSPLNDHHVIVGNTKGEMAQFDLKRLLMNAKFKGQAGSVRCIQTHSSAPLVASCGIDRFFRVHDIHTRKMVSKVYCKARLNTLLLRDSLSILTTEEEKDKEDWGKMVKKEEDEEGDVEWEDNKEEEDGDDVWKEIEKEEGEEEGEENDGSPPPAKRSKKEPKKKGGKKTAGDRKRREVEEEEEERPLKRKKVVESKRRKHAASTSPTVTVKRKRK